MADPSDIFRGAQRHQPLTLAPFLEFGYGSGSDTEDPPTLLSLDLFHRRRSPDLSPFSSPDPDPSFLGLGLGLGLGLELGFPDQEDQDQERHREQEQEDQEDWTGDEFFIGRRSSGGGPEFSRARFIDEDGLRILGFESDSEPDTDEQIVAIGSDPIVEEPGLPLCWDCLRIDEDDRRDPSASNAEDFEWEEIDGRTDIVSNMIREEHYEEELSFDIGGIGEEESHYRIQELDLEEEEVARTGIEWEVLLTMHHLGTESYYVEEGHDNEDGFVYTSEYDDVLFGQFQEHDSSLKGGPPAARSVVEGLPTVVLRKEDVGENDVNCAVCKDEISAEEKAKKLPCCHYYHEGCILPWLGMRNTCPLCRYELPTDDVEYESRKARMAGGNHGEDEEVRVRYDFEMLSED